MSIPVGKWIRGAVKKTRSGQLMFKTENPAVRRRVNVEMGFHDQYGVFHPIRASGDYSAARAGESRDSRSSTYRKKKGQSKPVPSTRGKKLAAKKKKAAPKRKTARKPVRKATRRAPARRTARKTVRRSTRRR